MPINQSGCQMTGSVVALQAWHCTFVAHVVRAAGRVEQNFRGALLALLETHLQRALAITITVDGECEVILVLVSDGLPEDGDVLALVEQERAVLVLVLFEKALLSIRYTVIISGRAYLFYPRLNLLNIVQLLHTMWDVSGSPIVDATCAALAVCVLQRLRTAAAREKLSKGT